MESGNRTQHMSAEELLCTQLEYQKKQYALLQKIAVGAAIALAAAIALTLFLMIRLNGMIDDLTTISSNLEKITTDLANADLETMVKNVNSLTATAESEIGNAMKKLDAVDIDSLNASIKALHDTIEPLSKFFSMFGR